MVKHDEPEKQEVGNPIADEEVDEGPMDEGEDPELAEIDDEGFEDEKEFSAVNDALDNISDALDKLEEQNDQLNEQLRSILEASQRMKSKRGNQNAPEDPSHA